MRLKVDIYHFLIVMRRSAPFTVATGMLADCWAPEERGKSMAIYTLAPLLGPVGLSSLLII